MSRSGYTEDCEDDWALIRWRGAVNSAIRGKRGQAFLREMLAALDVMPEKRLIAGNLVFDGHPEHMHPRPAEDIIVGGDQLVTGCGEVVRIGDVCAMGAIAKARAIDVSNVDPYDSESVSGIMGIATAMAREIAWINDDEGYRHETPEKRFERVRAWVASNIGKAADE